MAIGCARRWDRVGGYRGVSKKNQDSDGCIVNPSYIGVNVHLSSFKYCRTGHTVLEIIKSEASDPFYRHLVGIRSIFFYFFLHLQPLCLDSFDDSPLDEDEGRVLKVRRSFEFHTMHLSDQVLSLRFPFFATSSKVSETFQRYYLACLVKMNQTSIRCVECFFARTGHVFL